MLLLNIYSTIFTDNIEIRRVYPSKYTNKKEEINVYHISKNHLPATFRIP